MDLVSAAGADYFRGEAVRRLARAMSADPESNFVEELQTTTEDTYHFMSVVPGRENTLMILITDKSANLGLGWISMREALARIREEDGEEESDGLLPQRGEGNDSLEHVDMFRTSWRGGRAYRGSYRS